MRYLTNFPLFQSHLDLAHQYWKKIVMPGDQVIDATCGNGQDTLILCQLALQENYGKVYAIDILPKAIELTKNYLNTHLISSLIKNVIFSCTCHSTFPEAVLPESVSLITYNLGFLPGNDKNLTTLTDTTLQSITHALKLLKPNGLISLTCYPGHVEGAKEQTAILDLASQLSPRQWSCCHHQWLNRKNSPSLLLIQKTATHHI